MNQQNPVTLSEGRQAGLSGMERVAKVAEKTHPGWLELAYAYLELYVSKCYALEEFTAEMVIESSVARGILQPHDDRAWSVPFRRAARLGLIEKHPSKSGVCRKRHASVCVLWRKPA